MDIILALQIVITGIGATLTMDLWSLGQKHILNIPPLNYSLVGRWILWIPRGKLSHRTIVSTSPVRGEIFTGWAFHYLTGILFASVPIMLNGSAWFHEPSLLTGLLTGLLTLPAPLMILQPAFGFGIAASRTPRPWLARLLSLLTHLIYGVGLYSSTTVLLSFSQH